MNTQPIAARITTRARAPSRRMLVWLAIATLLAVLTPVTPAGASGTDGTATVNIYFTPSGSECDVVRAFDRTVTTPAVLTGAMEQLLAGPTPEEAAWLATQFSSKTAGMLRSVVIRDGVAHVDFKDLRTVIPNASTACGSASLLSQLDATATQFPTVRRARYSINGSEATFYRWLQRDVPGHSTLNATRGSLDNTARISRANGDRATLRRIRAGRHDGFDRVVFEFDDGLPSYLVEYTAVARSGGSGAPIPAGGTVALQINLGARTVDFDDEDFPRTFRPGKLNPRMPTLRTVRYGGEFEGLATFAAGLKGRSGFRVLELSSPARLAIDVAHGATVRWLRNGRRGADVRDWQEQLNTVQHGTFRSSWRTAQGPLATDGVFGRRTVRATRRFQRAEGVAVTGVVNPATRQAMRDASRQASRIPA